METIAKKIKSEVPLTLFMEDPKENFEQLLKTRDLFKISKHNYQLYDQVLEFDQMDDESALLETNSKAGF